MVSSPVEKHLTSVEIIRLEGRLLETANAVGDFKKEDSVVSLLLNSTNFT